MAANHTRPRRYVFVAEINRAGLQKIAGITRIKDIVMRSRRIRPGRPMTGASSPDVRHAYETKFSCRSQRISYPEIERSSASVQTPA
jgi:hypothetical protein